MARTSLRRIPSPFRKLMWMIFIGALGSGLWELLLHRAASQLAALASRATGSVVDTLLDLAFRGAGRWDGSTFLEQVLTPIVALLVVAAPWTLVTSYRRLLRAVHQLASRDSHEDLQRGEIEVRIPLAVVAWPRTITAVLCAFAILSAAIYVDIGLRAWGGRKTAAYEALVLDLLAPHAAPSTLALIRAQYRKVDDLDSLGVFLSTCKVVSEEHHITLPPFV